MNFKKTACLLIMSTLLITSLSACAGGKDSSSDAEGAPLPPESHQLATGQP